MCQNLHGWVPSAVHLPWVFGTQAVLTQTFPVAGGWTRTGEDFIAECCTRMSPAAATMDVGCGNPIKKQSELHKGKTVAVRNVVKCAALSETKKWG